MLPPTTILQRRYLIIRQLGRGGMGAVYEAIDQRLSRTVALKETLVETEELRHAFEREARLLANLNHPALPRVNDHFSEGSGQYLVMDYIPGDDLKEVLDRQGHPFAIEDVAQWAEELLDALEYLHTKDPSVIHRDIKPSNLKVGANGRIILLDFGLAKGRAGQMSVATSQSIHGYSPHFAPLEQIQGDKTTPRSDLYALAATLYHLLTGRIPPDAISRATALFNDEPDPLSASMKLGPDLPFGIASMLTKALALKPSERPANASEMLTFLRKGHRTPIAMGSVSDDSNDEATVVRTEPASLSILASDRLRARGNKPSRRLPLEKHIRKAIGIGQISHRKAQLWGVVAFGFLVAAIVVSVLVSRSPNSGIETSSVSPRNDNIATAEPLGRKANLNVNPASNANVTAANTNTSNEPISAIAAREPEKYRATYVLTAETQGGKKTIGVPELSAEVARNGNDRRVSFELPDGSDLVYLEQAGKHLVIVPGRKQYAELTPEATGWTKLLTPGHFVSRIKTLKGVERVGEEALNGRTAEKYRYPTTRSTGTQAGEVSAEAFVFVDKETGLPLRTELFTEASVKGAKIVAELRNITTDVDPTLFEVPAGFSKVPAEQVRAQIEAVTSRAAAVLRMMLTNRN